MHNNETAKKLKFPRMGCKVSSVQRVSVHARNADNVTVDNKHIYVAQKFAPAALRFVSAEPGKGPRAKNVERKKRAQPVNVRVG